MSDISLRGYFQRRSDEMVAADLAIDGPPHPYILRAEMRLDLVAVIDNYRERLLLLDAPLPELSTVNAWIKATYKRLEEI